MKHHTSFIANLAALLLPVGQSMAQYSTSWISPFDGLSGYHSAEDLTLLPNGDVAVSGVFTPTSTIEFRVAAFDGSGAQLWTTGLPDSIGRAWKIFELNDGTLLTLGDYEDQTGTNDVLARRFSTDGELLGQVVIDSPGLNTGDDFGDATMDAAGHVYLTGTVSGGGPVRPVLARFTPLGTLDWWATPPWSIDWVSFARGLAVETIGDSVAVIWSRNGSSYTAAIGYSSVGAWLWTTNLDMATTDNNNAMTADGLGHVFVGGARNQQFSVTKLDAGGAVAWTTDFAFPGLSSASGRVRHVRCDAQGDVYAVGEGTYQASIPGPYLLLAKLSSAGDVLWTDTLTGGAINYCLNMDHALLHDDRWTIATSYIGSYLYEYDTAGTRLFRQDWNVPGAQSSKVNAMEVGADGALYLAGRAQLVGAAGDGFVAKLLPMSTGLQDHHRENHALFPVPTTDRLHLPEVLSNAASIRISDIRGARILHAPYQRVLDVSHLPAGVYILEAHGQAERWRFVKE